MRVFLSFSSRDTALVRRVMLELVRHDIEVWDYSRPEERISAGRLIPEALSERIRAADAVVVLVSNASASPDSAYTALEVTEALDSGARIVPVRLQDSPPAQISDAFARLAGRRYVSLAAEPQRFTAAMIDLFAALGTPYRPAVVAHRRLPVFERFEAELAAANVALPHATFSDLGLMLQAFAQRYAVSDWSGAGTHITRFCDTVGYRWPHLRLYYPVVVKGVCELHVGDHATAERTFSGVLAHAAGDENAWAGRGHAFYARKHYAAAIADYTRAATIARAAGRSDVEIEINRLTAQLESGGGDGDEAVLRGALTDVLDADVPKVRLLVGIALQKRGDAEGAIRALTDVAASAASDVRDVAVTWLADTLAAAGQSQRACAHLRHWIGNATGDSAYWLHVHHQLARICIEAGHFESAVEIYDRVLCVEGAWTRQLMVEEARLLLALGDRGRALALAERARAAQPFGLPQTPQDYYYFGFALFLLGQREAADSYFQLAGTGYPHYSADSADFTFA